MVNRELEIKIKKLKEFMQLWIKFHDMYKDALSRETIAPDEENTFLETKSLIARKYQALRDQLEIGASYEDKTFDVVSQLLSLKSVAAISDLSLNKIENDWHNSYILLNKILGELEGQQEALRKVSRIGLFVKNLASNPILNLVIVIIIVLAIYFLVNYLRGTYGPQQEEIKGKIEFREK
jgi:hypothetical protein